MTLFTTLSVCISALIILGLWYVGFDFKGLFHTILIKPINAINTWSEKRRNRLDPKNPPPAHISYSLLFSIIDEVIEQQWKFSEMSLEMNNIDRGVMPEEEVRRITSLVMNSFSPTLMRDINYYVTNKFLIEYISRKCRENIYSYVERRRTAQSVQYTKV